MTWLDALSTDADLQNQRNALEIGSTLEPDLLDGSGVATLKGLGQGIAEAGFTAQRLILKDENGRPFKPTSRETFARQMDRLTPKPDEVGAAANIMHSAARILPRTALGSAVGGLPGAMAMAGLPEYDASLARNEALGVDVDTAKKTAAIDAATLGIGVALPGSFAKALPADIIATVTANAGLNAASRKANQEILKANGYETQAKMYENTAETFALDAGLALGFMGLSRAANGQRYAPKEVIDAALTENLNRTLTEKTAPGIPTDLKSGAIHQRAMEEAIRQIAEGQPVQITESIEKANFIRPDSKPLLVSKGAMQHLDIAKEAGEKYGVSPDILIAQIDVESAGNPLAISKAGAKGVAQFMPKTAKQYGVDVGSIDSSIDGQARYMKDLLDMFGGDVKKALAGYNWGQGRVKKAADKHGDNWLKHAPKETQDYVRKIMAKARRGSDASDELTVKVTENRQAAIEEYNAINDEDVGSSEGGRVLNTDLARELSTIYKSDRSKSADVHEEASRFIKELYEEKLSQPTPEGRMPVVLFTAGGTGAGKSSALKSPAVKNAYDAAEIVYDTNMNKLESSVKKIEQALKAGREVRIVYTYRDPVEALSSGALPRAEKMGRTVPLNAHAETHTGASKTIRELQQKYADEPRVAIIAVDNSRGKGNQELVSLDKLPVVEDNFLLERLSNELESQYQTGKISERTYHGTRAVYQPDQQASATNTARAGISDTGNSQRTVDEPARKDQQTQVAQAISLRADKLGTLPISGTLKDAFKQLNEINQPVERFLETSSLSPDLENMLIGLSENATPERIGAFLDDLISANYEGRNTFDVIADSVDNMRAKAVSTSVKSPEMEAARQLAQAHPEMIIDVDGKTMTIQDVLNMADDELKQAEVDSKAFDAAVLCFLRSE